jgi:ABC-type sugar transport system substrate-binding protein
MPHHQSRRAALVAVTLTAAIGLAACSSSTAQPTGGASAPAAGSSAASTAAPSAKNKPFTIGFVEITEASPVVIQTTNEFKRGAALLGWNVEVANANADPSQMAAGVSAMVNKGVDALITMAIPPSAAAQGLAAAKAKGIPTLEIGAPVTDPNHLYDAQYAPDDKKMSSMVVDQMIKDLGGKGELLVLLASNIDAIELRVEALKEKIQGTNIKITASHEIDLANAVQDSQSAVSNGLRANPTINAVFAPQDFEFTPSVTTIVSQNLRGAGVYCVYLNPSDFALLRKHDVPMAIADSPIKDVAWYALDALVNKLVLNKADWVTDMSVHPLPYVLVTPQNVPAQDAWPYEDFSPVFQERWKGEGVTLNG